MKADAAENTKPTTASSTPPVTPRSFIGTIMSFAEQIDFPNLMESVALHLLGEPNRKLSTSRKLRWGNHGSMSVDLVKGTFYDHEVGKGGVRRMTSSSWLGAAFHLGG